MPLYDADPTHARSAAQRKASPHPLHRALAECLYSRAVHFVCEKRIGCYYVDFCLPRVGLVLEIDGQNFHDPVRDAHRDGIIKQADYEVLHFPPTMSAKEIAQDVMLWIAEHPDDCHRCRNAPSQVLATAAHE